MISVVMPVYNCESYLDPILNALWNQTYQNFEVVCVNDGSTDGSLAVLERHQKQHSNLKIITTPNSGPSMARNRGIDEASGDYICFIDSDDMVTQDYLEVLYKEIKKYDADMSVCFIKRVYEYNVNSFVKGFKYIQNYNVKNPSTLSDDSSLLVNVLNAPYAKLIRKDYLNQHQIRFIKGKIAQDFLLTKTVLLCGAKVVAVPVENYLYTVRKGSITTGNLHKAYDLRDVYEELVRLVKSMGLWEKYHTEVEYLCFYHLGIDMSFRLFKGSKNLFKSIAPAREVVKKYGFKTNNPYIHQLNWFAQLYLRFFFSL